MSEWEGWDSHRPAPGTLMDNPFGSPDAWGVTMEQASYQQGHGW